MQRRSFMALGGAALAGAALGRNAVMGAETARPPALRIAWSRHGASGLFERVSVEGRALVDPADRAGPCDGFVSLIQDGKAHGGPLSRGGIELMRALRAAVKSFGPEKALFASDCSMANFCLWGDGEGGDHCYDRLLGSPLYRQQPVRYTAALGAKAWLPCAWLCASLWPAQVDLARVAGAAVSVTNGWGDGFGLTHLPAETRARMLRDIASLAGA